jgi:HSP20 family protein
MSTEITTKAVPAHRVDPFPRLWDWFENMMPMDVAWREGAGRSIKVEEFTRDGRYVVRAELPGVDPDKDIDVSVAEGLLTIRGERREEVREDQRSEFYYGSFTRTMTLPAGADPDAVTAEYKDGILEVSFAMPEPATEPTHVLVTRKA